MYCSFIDSLQILSVGLYLSSYLPARCGDGVKYNHITFELAQRLCCFQEKQCNACAQTR